MWVYLYFCGRKEGRKEGGKEGRKEGRNVAVYTFAILSTLYATWYDGKDCT